MLSCRVTRFQCNQVGVEFVLVELDLAITFCEVGLATRDFARAERNAENARTALEAVLKTKERLLLNQQARQIICTKTSKLAALLVQLERRLTSSILASRTSLLNHRNLSVVSARSHPF